MGGRIGVAPFTYTPLISAAVVLSVVQMLNCMEESDLQEVSY